MSWPQSHGARPNERSCRAAGSITCSPGDPAAGGIHELRDICAQDDCGESPVPGRRAGLLRESRICVRTNHYRARRDHATANFVAVAVELRGKLTLAAAG